MNHFDLVLELILLTILSVVGVYLFVLREPPAPLRSGHDRRAEEVKEGTR